MVRKARKAVPKFEHSAEIRTGDLVQVGPDGQIEVLSQNQITDELRLLAEAALKDWRAGNVTLVDLRELPDEEKF